MRYPPDDDRHYPNYGSIDGIEIDEPEPVNRWTRQRPGAPEWLIVGVFVALAAGIGAGLGMLVFGG